MANPKRPKDTNERAKLIVDILTGETQDINPDEGKNPAAVELGRLGGLKGGKARALKLSPKKRKDIAQKAATLIVKCVHCGNYFTEDKIHTLKWEDISIKLCNSCLGK